MEMKLLGAKVGEVPSGYPPIEKIVLTLSTRIGQHNVTEFHVAG